MTFSSRRIQRFYKRFQTNFLQFSFFIFLLFFFEINKPKQHTPKEGGGKREAEIRRNSGKTGIVSDCLFRFCLSFLSFLPLNPPLYVSWFVIFAFTSPDCRSFKRLSQSQMTRFLFFFFAMFPLIKKKYDCREDPFSLCVCVCVCEFFVNKSFSQPGRAFLPSGKQKAGKCRKREYTEETFLTPASSLPPFFFLASVRA